ncbi:helix-turn-helix domain-containing protein [Catenulispora sp. NL8]|uniref:Helix-turn-helix domain-containing protein n=1 Tax=Catenulispora pinistramenti TaxID=2705254 RepID=A0ABS5L6I9_9ACTN|nr:helix-turn-helix transcriptional regulator [Catenulispora pinistramenti]MBS2553973.1 helix-turn-helix domain-containing protein [Catenulispora pinistramenti]
MGEQSRFGAELRARRVAAGLSLGTLAAYLRYSKGYLSKIETGRMPARPELARRCDTYLKADGALAALAEDQPSAHEALEAERAERAGNAGRAADVGNAGPDLHQPWTAGFDGDAYWFAAVPRRDVLAAGAGALIAVGLDAGLAPRSAAARDEHATRAFETLFGQMRTLGQTASPALVLPTLVAQTETLRSLAARASAATRNRLLRLTSRYAEFTGWMAQEAGSDSGALWWTELAARLADAAGDTTLVAYTGIRRGLVAMYQGDGAATVAAVRDAEHSRWSPAIREQAARRAAQGYALQGDHAACLRALDRARELGVSAMPAAAPASKPAASRSSVSSASQPPNSAVNKAFTLGPTTMSDPLAITTGWCLFDLARWEQAADVLAPATAALSPDAARNRARYGARLALAHAALGDVPQATAITAALLDQADAADSATIRTDLRRLSRTLNRHSADPAVRALSPRLTASL